MEVINWKNVYEQSSTFKNNKPTKWAFIEDFVNHRFWGFKEEFGHYFPNINVLKFAYFYSRGDIEPYVMLDEQYTMQVYGSLEIVKPVYHFVLKT